MKMKLIPFLSVAVLAAALSTAVYADTTPTPTPSGKEGKHDINKWLDKHPKIKAKVLEKFDANHNGVIDGDEVAAVKKWREERKEKKSDEGKGKHKGDKDAAATPTPTPSAQ